MKDSKKAHQDPAPTPARKRLPAPDRFQVATRLEESIYRKVAEAAAANHSSVAAEVERRIAQSFEVLQTRANDDLQDFERDLMLSFKAGGLRMNQSLGMKAVAEAEPSVREWMNDPSSYTEAASRALEVIADWHPKPTYGHCLLMIYALRARLDRGWRRLLNDADEEERRKLLEHADAVTRQMTAPSLLDPLPKPHGEKAED